MLNVLAWAFWKPYSLGGGVDSTSYHHNFLIIDPKHVKLLSTDKCVSSTQLLCQFVIRACDVMMSHHF